MTEESQTYGLWHHHKNQTIRDTQSERQAIGIGNRLKKETSHDGEKLFWCHRHCTDFKYF